uniref:Uncharacterized protein n=1 Tax=Spermophilus dauricus TaxID=99837 RepID=A0A8C9PUA7_SPEDA
MLRFCSLYAECPDPVAQNILRFLNSDHPRFQDWHFCDSEFISFLRVLISFLLAEEAPSTASSTPDSTEGKWMGGYEVGTERDLPPQPGLGDSLESIPSLSQSPEPGRRGDPDTVPPAGRPLEDLRLRLDQLGWAARGVGSGEDSATSSSTPLEDEEPDGLEEGAAKEELDLQRGFSQSSPPEVLTPQPSPSCRTPEAGTPSQPGSPDSNSGPDEPSLAEEEEPWGPLEPEPVLGQCLHSRNQSEFTLQPHILGKQCVSRCSLGLQQAKCGRAGS